MNKIKVYIKYPHRAPYAAWIANKLESLQRIVGGYIETVTCRWPDGQGGEFADLAEGQRPAQTSREFVIICNEEGRLHGLPVNCKVCGIEFVGPIVFAGIEGEEFASVPVDINAFRILLPDLWPAAGKKGEDRISLKKTAALLAEMFCAKPCQLSSLHKGIARRLPLRCSFTPELCDHRSVAECWGRLLGYPTMADDIKEE